MFCCLRTLLHLYNMKVKITTASCKLVLTVPLKVVKRMIKWIIWL